MNDMMVIGLIVFMAIAMLTAIIKMGLTLYYYICYENYIIKELKQKINENDRKGKMKG